MSSDADSRTQALATASKWLSLLVIAVGCLVLAGWASGIDILMSFIPGQVTMKPNTALGIVLASTALWLWHGCISPSAPPSNRQTPTATPQLTFPTHSRAPSSVQLSPPWQSRLIWILALLVIGLGGLTLLEYAFGINSLPFNRFGFETNSSAVDAIAKSQMVANTAFNFVLMGGALILLMTGQYSLFQSVSLASFLIAFLAIMGHLYAASALYGAGAQAGMAINTAGAFVLLAIACLLAAADRGWMQQINSDRAGGMLARRLMPLVLAAPLILGLLSFWLYENSELSINTITALRTLADTCVFLGIIWWNTRRLNQIDAHRQHIQNELIQTNLQLRAIFDRAYQFIGLLLPDGTVTAINNTALEFGGLTIADVVGKPFWQARWWTLSPETQLQLQTAIAQAAQGEFVRYEVDVRGAGDQITTIDFSLQPIFDDAGHVTLIIPEGRDISDRKRAEAALQQFNAELEQRVAERTAEVYAANQQLRQSEVRYRRLFDANIIGIEIAHVDGRIVDANDALLDLLGYSRAELEAGEIRWDQLTPPEYEAQDQAALEELVQSGAYAPFEKQYFCKNGQRVDILIGGALFENEPNFGVAFVLNISDRKRAESRLRQSEQQFRHAVEQAPFPILIHTENGDILQVSQALTDITGYQAEQIRTTADWTRLAYGEAQNVVIEDINHLYELNQRVDEGEYPIRCQDGSERIWAFSSSPLGHLPDGQRMVISMAADVTERQRAEAALAKRLKQQRVITQLGQAALTSHSLKSLLQQATTQVAQLLEADYCKVLELLPDGATLRLKAGVGWQAGLVGQATVGINDGSQAAYTLRSHEPVVVRDLSTDTRFNRSPLLGQHRVVSGISTIIEGRGDQPYGVLGVYSTRYQDYSPDDVNVVQAVATLLADAIARHQAEQEVNQLNITLEQRVAERTRQVEEANKELEAFSYSIAHDLRAPLRSIQGFSLALLEDYGEQIDELGQEYMHRMVSSAEHLDTLIQDLLDYSRLGRAEIKLQPIAIDAILEGLLNELEPAVQAKQAEIRVNSPLPLVLAQRSVLTQVLTNLIENALKFTVDDTAPQINIWAEVIDEPSSPARMSPPEPSQSQPPTPELSTPESSTPKSPNGQVHQPLNGQVRQSYNGQVRSHSQSTDPSPTDPSTADSSPHQWIRLWIEDNGIGIEPQYQERIFRAFERLHGIEAYPGTGIGLAIVYRGVTRMGGHVGLESEFGQGSRFWIELQAAEPTSTAGPLN